MAKRQQLLDSQLRALRPDNSDYWKNDSNGLYIRVRPTGTKSFVLRRKVNGKTIRTTLGQYPSMSLKQARLEAGRERLKDQESKREKINFLEMTDVRTFGELLERFYEEQIERDYKQPRQIRLYIDHVADAFASLGRNDWVFGPASDGGYWLVGARRRPVLTDPFAKVRWSTDKALADTLAGLHGARIGFVAQLDDVDEAADLHELGVRDDLDQRRAIG